MLRHLLLLVGLIGLTLVLAGQTWGAELLLPQNRAAFFSDETIELAVVGLAAGAQATLEITATTPGVHPVKLTATGDGSTLLYTLPPLALMSGVYNLALDGKPAGQLTIASGVRQSTMFVSQSAGGWSNFTVSNAFSFGLLDADGQPLLNVRDQKSGTMKMYETAIAANQPALCYMYWTGYVTHKPFGTLKSWANADMMDTMRLMSFSTAQRLRRYGHAVLSIGTIDEPGLAWGATPAGGMASGFPNWDEKPWYEKRGWTYTQDIASGSDADWMKYMSIRCSILGDNFRQASKDIKASWPTATFATDAYALSAIMDGTDSMNQLANDIPTSHVFFDWFGGPMAVPGQIQLEKAACPQAKLAHAMNGQLMGNYGTQSNLFRLLMNGMLQGGIHSNWWLNPGGMSAEDLTTVNQPVAAIGPLFQSAELTGYDTAVLWSFTEAAMRQKAMAALESKKENGKQISLMVPLPDAADQKQFAIDGNAYEVGYTQVRPVLAVHQVLRRAGYPAQIIDERLLPQGALKQYKVLVIVGQTFPLPQDIMNAISAFIKKGGKVVVDKSTTIAIPGAIVFAQDYGANAFRQRDYQWQQQVKAAGDNKIEASKWNTTEYTEEAFARNGVPAMKAAMAQAGLQPVVTTEAQDLSIDRQRIGQGLLISVLNGHEALPATAPSADGFPRYNAAAYNADYSLTGIKPGSAVYVIEGTDWSKTRQLTGAKESATFGPGEMKLYLVAPTALRGLKAVARVVQQQLELTVTLNGVKMAWPLNVSIAGPDGKALYTVARSTGKDGVYVERFPLSAVAPAGVYTAAVSSLPGGFSTSAKTTFAPSLMAALPIADKARVFDSDAIARFLKSKPALVIALGDTKYQPAATQLAAALTAAGIPTTIKPEMDMVRKVLYPRVWNPTATLYTPAGDPKPLDAAQQVKVKATISTTPDGKVVITDDQGKALNDVPVSALVTISDGGYLQWQNRDDEVAYEPGIVAYVDKDGTWKVLNGAGKPVPTTADFKAKWAKPWTQLTSYFGGYQMVPELPEAFTTDAHLLVLGDSAGSEVMRVLQASEILPQTADAKYPGPGKALLQFAWSPFTPEKNAIVIGATDDAGLQAGIQALLKLAK